MSGIFGFLIFTQVAAITIKNKEAIDQGFCHLQNVKIQMLLACNLSFNSTVTIALAENETDTSGNYILQCFGIPGKQIDCPQQDYATGAYNECNDILEVEFIFDYTKHIQHYLRIWTDCNSSSIAMKPCRFTGNVDLSNSPAITVTCQNPTFVYSNSPIMIKSNKGIYGICLQRKCFGDNCKKLSDGIQCVLHYDPDEILQCQLDGAIFNITSTSPNASTTSPENSSTLQKNKTTESQGGSSTSQNITSTSPEQSTSLNSKTTPITSSEITESEHDIQTSEGSTDMTANLPNVKPLELSSKSCDQCDKSVLYVFISLFGLSLLFNFIFITLIIRLVRNSKNRAQGNEGKCTL